MSADAIRACIEEVCGRIDYWIDEGGLSHSEICFILQEVDWWFAPDEEEEEEITFEEEED